MIKEVIFEKVKDIIIPDVMQKFHEVDFPPIDHGNFWYRVKIYDLVLDVIPLSPQQMVVEFHEDKNAMYIEVNNIEFTFHASAYARLLFISSHGSATLQVDIGRFKFMVNPVLIADGDSNELTYNVDELDIYVQGATITHLSFGGLPTWLFRGICNLALRIAVSTYDAFRKPIEEHVIKVLNEKRKLVPISLPIPNYPLSVSLSFPNNIFLKSDRLEVPFDGTIFLTKSGYDPQVNPAPPMPSYNDQNPNNFQLFLNQHMLKTTFDAVKAASLKATITKDTLAPLDLSQNIMTSEYFNMLFPFMS